ncbi:MAG: hypothetical protein ACK2U2_02755 [Anaerolineae bacterium]
MTKTIPYPIVGIVLRMIKPWRLSWLDRWLPEASFVQQDLKRESSPFKIRWAWVLLLAITILLVMGEFGPAASAIAGLP